MGTALINSPITQIDEGALYKPSAQMDNFIMIHAMHECVLCLFPSIMLHFEHKFPTVLPKYGNSPITQIDEGALYKPSALMDNCILFCTNK